MALGISWGLTRPPKTSGFLPKFFCVCFILVLLIVSILAENGGANLACAVSFTP